MPRSAHRIADRSASRLVRLLAVAAGLVGLCAAGCSSSKPESDWDGAENLQFSEDARDPTERATEGGWYRFRPVDEPTGTANPLSPSRRTHGIGSNGDNP